MADRPGLEVAVEPEVPALLHGDPGLLRRLLADRAGRGPGDASGGPVTVTAALEEESRTGFLLYFSVRHHPQSGTAAFFTMRFGRPQRGASGAPPLAALRGLALLVAGFDPDRRKALAAPLVAAGARVAEAASAGDALLALRAGAGGGRPLAVAVVQESLAGATGEELARRVRDEASLDATALVLVAASGRRGDAARAAAAGFAAYLSLPLAEGTLEEAVGTVAGAPRPAAIVTRHAVVEARKRRLTLLVVEGNASRRMILAGLLGNLGYRTTAVASGEEALAALRRARHDLVLMDVATRGVGGLDAVRRLRCGEADVLDREVAVVGLTSAERIDVRGHALAVGMNDVAVKPVGQDHLAALIARWGRCTATGAPPEGA